MARDRANRTEAKPHRLFVAIEVGDEAKRAVSTAIEPWRRAFPSARWTPSENWHVTVKFLGWTYPRLVPWLGDRLRAAAADLLPFGSSLTELGAFPVSARARVMWVGLDDRSGRMAEVAHVLDAALANEFAPETRAFRPHLTVARSDPPMRLPDDFAATALEPVAIDVDEMVLFRSHLRRPAPRYEAVSAFRFGDGAAPDGAGAPRSD
jgi:2'-5' RNA ligase